MLCYILGILSLFFHFIRSHDNGGRRICVPGIVPICCPGWYNGLNAPCSIPSCAGNCGDDGRCIKPDVCLCGDGRQRFECENINHDVMQADQALNSCPENCQGRGNCVASKCQCHHGYTGERCEVAIESSCFAVLQRGLCASPMQHLTRFGNATTLLTRELCCHTFGIAWSEPCQPCKVGRCGHGYRNENGFCKDIDECRLAGVCRGGKCTNLEGTYNCECPKGYEYDKQSLQCVLQRDPCGDLHRKCSPGGHCVPVGYSDFQCLCRHQFVAAQDHKSCIRRKKNTFDFCSLYEGSICQNGFCVSRDNSYECICNDGFEASIDRKSCHYKIDMCAIHRGQLCANGECVSTGRDYHCNCKPGFISTFDRRRCITRCEQLGASICQNGQCVSEQNGDYVCQCFPGFQPSIDGKWCFPIQQPLDYLEYATETGQITADYYPSSSHGTPKRRKPAIGFETDYQRDHGYAKYSRKHFPGYTSWLHRTRRKSLTPCERREVIQNCAGGFCLNLGGSAYQCECLPDHVSSDNNRICIPNTAILNDSHP